MSEAETVNNDTFNDTFTDDLADEVIGGVANEPPRVLIYGPEKAGKSTWGASAAKPIFIPTEDGLGRIGCQRFPLAQNWPTFMQYVGKVRHSRHGYETLVIDSLDWLERLIWAKVCGDSNAASIELAAGGYGKGYNRAAEMFYELLTQHLEPIRQQRGMAVILIAHAKVEKAEIPGLPAYDRSSPRLDKRAIPIVCEWVDCIGFVTKKIRVEEDKAARGERNIAKVRDGERILIVADSNPSCVSGNRYGITNDLPLSWEAFAAAAFGQPAA